MPGRWLVWLPGCQHKRGEKSVVVATARRKILAHPPPQRQPPSMQGAYAVKVGGVDVPDSVRLCSASAVCSLMEAHTKEWGQARNAVRRCSHGGTANTKQQLAIGMRSMRVTGSSPHRCRQKDHARPFCLKTGESVVATSSNQIPSCGRCVTIGCAASKTGDLRPCVASS